MVYNRPLRSDELMHFGIKGMKWGVRRYQNKDGSLTPLGRKKYGSKENYEYQRNLKKAKRAGWLGLGAAAAGVGAASAGLGAAAYEGAKRKEEAAKAEAEGKDLPEPTKSESAAQALLSKDIKQGKGKENISSLESVTKNINSVTNDSAMTLQRVSDLQKRKMSEVKNPEIEREMASMSNKDLQDYITRQNLERQYRTLRTPDIQTGAEKAAEIIQIVGGVTAIAASLATIGATVYKIKHG